MSSIIFRNMKEIYSHIIENNSFYEESFPMQIIVVDSIDYVNEEHKNEQIVCYLEREKKTGLCLVRNSENPFNKTFPRYRTIGNTH